MPHLAAMDYGGQDFVDIGRRIRLLRKALGYDNAAQFAAHAGLSPQQISNWETGKTRPEVSMAIKLCVRTGATLDFIYWGRDAGLPLNLATAIQDYRRRSEPA